MLLSTHTIKGIQKDTAIIVKRATRLEELKSHFNTEAQAKFYIKQKKVAFKQKQIFLKAPYMAKEEVMLEEAQALESAEKEYSDYVTENDKFFESFDILQKSLNTVIKTKILEQNYISNSFLLKKTL